MLLTRIVTIVNVEFYSDTLANETCTYSWKTSNEKKKIIKNGPMYKNINSTPPPQKKNLTKKQKNKNSDTQF